MLHFYSISGHTPANQSAQTFTGCVHQAQSSWNIQWKIHFDLSTLFILFIAYIVIHLPISRPKTYFWVSVPGPYFREYALKNSLLYLQFFLRCASLSYFLIAYLSYAHQSVGQKLTWSVCAWQIIQETYPEKFISLSPVISEICLIRLLFYSIHWNPSTTLC